MTTAYELAKTGKYEITILEASDRIGGISCTINCDGNRMDIGGHRFFSKDSQVNDWWEKMLPLQGAPSYDDRQLSRDVALSSSGPDPEQTDRVMLARSRVSRIYYGNKFFDYPISLNVDTLKTMGITTALKVGFSFLYDSVHRRPEDNLENYYINSFGKKLYSMFFEGYTEKVWGKHPKEIDASWGVVA